MTNPAAKPIKGRTEWTMEDLTSQPPKTYEGKRKCAELGCITLLDRYNEGPYCRCHVKPPNALHQKIERKKEEENGDGAEYPV